MIVLPVLVRYIGVEQGQIYWPFDVTVVYGRPYNCLTGLIPKTLTNENATCSNEYTPFYHIPPSGNK